MPKIVVNFSRNPSDEWESLVGLAETSRNVIELARLYQFGKRRGFRDLMNAAMARARQLGFRPSELEADQRGILRNPSEKRWKDDRGVWVHMARVERNPSEKRWKDDRGVWVHMARVEG
jgi:hypothetical protein